MDATTVAIDLAKDVFQVALANRAGRIIDRQRLTRRQFERFLDTLAAGTEVIMEVVRHRALLGTAMPGTRPPGSLAARAVRAAVRPAQQDGPHGHRSPLEAARCGEIRPVPVKTVEQQTLQAIHRVRTQWQTARVARINAMRGLLARTRPRRSRLARGRCSGA